MPGAKQRGIDKTFQPSITERSRNVPAVARQGYLLLIVATFV